MCSEYQTTAIGSIGVIGGFIIGSLLTCLGIFVGGSPLIAAVERLLNFFKRHWNAKTTEIERDELRRNIFNLNASLDRKDSALIDARSERDTLRGAFLNHLKTKP